MLSTFQKLENQILHLKKNYSLIGIKAEFETEGSSYEDVALLRHLTSKTNTKLYVKVGGVEALNDIRFLISLNIDGIIAPMVETEFAAWKFISSINKNYLDFKPHLSINIESKTAIDNFEKIYKISKNDIDNITIGRTDLSQSFFNKKITPNSDYILKKIIEISNKVDKKDQVTITVGGGIDKNTLEIYKKVKNFKNKINKMETRKVILPVKSFLNKKKAIESALKFEELYLLMKNEIINFKSKSDLSRLAILRTRK